jgi:hypothetical protein
MARPDFDPPIALRGSVVVVTIHDAVTFLRSYDGSRYPVTQDAVLRRLESATSTAERDLAAAAFRTWAHAEGLLSP